MQQISIFGVRLDDMTNDELRARFLDMLQESRSHLVTTPNPEMILGAQKNTAFYDTLQKSTLALPDGVALRFAAAALQGHRNLHRHPGVDVLPMLVELCRDRGFTLILLGATDDILAQTKMRFTTLFQGISLITVNPGIINEEDPELPFTVIANLRFVGPCVIAVALGQGHGKSQGKQERVAAQIVREVPGARIVIGVGGALDVLSGSISRAPKMFQRFGFEWVWRLWHEPWRFRRIFRAVIVFPIMVVCDTLRTKTFRKALISVVGELRSHFFSLSQ